MAPESADAIALGLKEIPLDIPNSLHEIKPFFFQLIHLSFQILNPGGEVFHIQFTYKLSSVSRWAFMR